MTTSEGVQGQVGRDLGQSDLLSGNAAPSRIFHVTSSSSMIIKMVRHPREAVTAPSLPEFEKHLDNSLRNTVCILGSLVGARSWTP